MFFGLRFVAGHLHRVKRGFALLDKAKRVCKVIAFDATQ